MSAKRIEYISDPSKFDLITHRWDGQGKLVSKNLYRAHLTGGRTYFERPVNSGNLWFENNKPAGRVIYTFGDDGKIASKKFDFEAEHASFTPPLTGTEKMHYELEQTKARTAELEAELSAIKKERATMQTKVEKTEVKSAPAVQAAPTLPKKG